MMMKLNIFNIKNFLQVANQCVGPIEMINTDGRRENISKNPYIQRQLTKNFDQNRGNLSLSINIPNAHDYMDIICYYIGDC